MSFWVGTGSLAGGLLALAMRASNAFALSGLLLILVALAWTLGPAKTPMVWSEGALMSYQGNATHNEKGYRVHHRRAIAVPAFAFAAGLLLLAAAGVIAAV